MKRSVDPFFPLFLLLTILLPGYYLLSGCGGPGEKVTREDPVFRKVSADQSGIRFNNSVDENYQKNYFDKFAYVYNGGGVAIGDINNDGLQDLYFTGNDVPNKLFLNEGNLKFRDITGAAGVDGGKGWDNGVTMVDINHDGLLDIYVCKGGFEDSDEDRRNLLYINQGDLTFKEEAKAYGLDEDGYSTHAVFFDMDNDNDLDAYIISRPDTFYLGLSQMVEGKRNPPEKCRDKLYRNDNGKFTEIGKRAGINHNYGFALAALTADLNNDGYEDIFVSNDYADNDYMYINQGDGTFRDEVKKATNHLSLFSMGADIADINNDGLEDILVMEMLPEDYKRAKVSIPRTDVQGFWATVDSGFHKQYMHNVLHLNQGNGFFSDVSLMAGIEKTEWSWVALAADFNNDGNKDIFVTNGYRRDIFDGDIQQKMDAYMNANKARYNSYEDFFTRGFKGFIGIYDPIRVRNYLFKNSGNLRFENVSEAWGFTDSSFSNGAAIADLDNDGDLDLVVNNLDEDAFLYENVTDKKNNYIRLRLKGPGQNPEGIGAKVTVFNKDSIQFFEQKTVRGYLSSNEPFIHFGLGKLAKIDSIRVQWLGGRVNILRDVLPDQVLTVDYADAEPAPVPFTPQPMLFSESPQILDQSFVHRENALNEYRDQVLLPHEFGKSGPFMATGDVNGDGREDFFIGGASGQPGVLYQQKGNQFVRQDIAAFNEDSSYEDMGALFFDMDGDGDLDLYVVSGGSEFPEGSPRYQDRIYINDGKGGFSRAADLPVTTSSGSCVVACDIDGDGDLDLFRGGQVVPHAYPNPPRSYILMNENGRLVDRTASLAPDLLRPGMVNSALWADLDGDKKEELVLAGEWMPIRVFQNKGGKLEDVSARYGFEHTEGWWNKLVAADIDGDGDMDLVAGNLGENYDFRASDDKPFEVFAGDIDHNGTNDIFLAYHLNNRLVPVRGRESLALQCPMIAQRLPTFHAFADADLNEILGDGIRDARHYQARLFSTVLFINDGGKFSRKKLPWEAQLSTANGIIIHDFDGDGIQDMLLAGNKFDVEIETTPADASPGLFMKGIGNNEFRSYKPSESGFFVPYNVKDIRMLTVPGGEAIVVSSNNDSLRVFLHNGH